MLTNLQNKKRRITRQIRVEEKLHQKLKFLAVERNMTISKLVGEILIQCVPVLQPKNKIKNRIFNQ